MKKYTHPLPSQTTIFAYSYAALKLFRYAKAQGWKTVLGQIDAGLVHQEIIQQKFVNYPNYHENFELAPAEYWQDWLEECFLADKILVNSSWSKKALEKKGMPNKKIYIVPLAYQNSTFDHNFIRKYPPSFSHKRPLKVLFLGRITLGKGIAALLEATELLQDEPIEFWFVGSVKIQVPQRIKDNKKIKFLGAVSRSTTAQYYQQADLFLFPTLSDGFGLTQLEAQAWQLPIIASPFCGEVVKDNINGLTLPEVNGNEITKALSFCLKNPNKLQNFARNSHDFSEFSLDNLQEQLVKLDLERKD
ncbi:glycosyltransferase family 4 protein [Xenococcus sp. PCC 7305]|uniref:glycosyltransferase family 4 protein n=1 Tax=Xenococcus sp. PCC 7305 TaxID=102125 RepID=UPI001930D709|nr:glycosyltransferase family 4 protein [Xenococcus sp. PCC 7305]